MEEAHFQKIAFRYSGSTVLGLLRTKLGAKIAPRWAQDGAKIGQDGPRMAFVGKVGSALGRSWSGIVQKLPEEWKMAVA